jgi:23S rRNA pseudouridine1911/1915/1917 synthase
MLKSMLMSDFDDIDDQEEAGGFRKIFKVKNSGRLDKLLTDLVAEMQEGLSRSRLKNLILEGQVLLNDRICPDPSHMVKEGDRLELIIPPPVNADPVPENIPLDIIYEDEDLLVINKQAGLVVHPGAGNPTGTLVNALLYYCGDELSGIGGVKRPGIVHRLDKETTGLMMVAKSDRAHQGLAAQLADRSLSRIYTALVWKMPTPIKGSVDAPIGRHQTNRLKMSVRSHKMGREAVTHYLREETYKDTMSRVICELETGRTHQIRVHMQHLGHPLIGDTVYGLPEQEQRSLLNRARYDEEVRDAIMAFPRQALHAGQIHFIHPVTDEEMAFEAPLPYDMVELLNLINS